MPYFQKCDFSQFIGILCPCVLFLQNQWTKHDKHLQLGNYKPAQMHVVIHLEIMIRFASSDRYYTFRSIVNIWLK